MSASREYLEARLVPSPDKAVIIAALAYVKGPGTPAETQTTPDFIGQEYYDTSEEQFWKATSPTEWKRITSDNP